MRQQVALGVFLLTVVAASWLWAAGQQANPLEEKVAALEKRISDLEKRVAALEGSRQPASSQAASSPASPSGKAAYVGNANSLKFHRPTCEWAQRISPAGRVELSSREEAIKQGYAPCKVCKP